ncbi:MAG TPA: SMP-30/gluconolactonase/LRE family protein [Acidimicrobiales bacterium]
MTATSSTPRPPRVLLSDLVLGESPRWHDGRLWVCDWGAQELLTVDADGGRRQVVHRVTSLPFCIDWLADGRLLVVASADRTLLREAADGTLEPHADLRPLADHPWNEVVADGRGGAYVNTIGYEMMSGQPPAPGAVARVAADGSARLVAGDLAFPNGMAITPDGATLVVAESHAGRLTAFSIDAAGGGLSDRRVWADLGDAAPDGICLDAEGAAWYADVPHRRCVRVREGGEVLQTVELDRGCFSCALGGPDGRTLFVVAADWGGPDAVGADRTGQVVAVEAPAPAAPRPAA